MNRLKDLRACAAALLFLAAFLIYLATLSPSVYFGDCGELISMSYTLGIPHPTGFPIYILLGKIFSFLPLANTAFRFNIMSALFAALVPVALFFIFHIFVRNEENKTLRLYLPFAAAALFIFSYTLWSQAVIARIYTLNALFCALALLCFLYYMEIAPDNRALYLLAFLTGFGSGLHLTAVMFAGILWIYLAIKEFSAVKKIVFPLLALAMIGASIHLYTVIRSRAELVLKWQKLGTLADFFSFITQQQYKRKMFTRTAQGYSHFFWFIKDVIIREFSGAGFFAALFAVVLAMMNRFKYIWLFMVLFLSNILLMAAYGTYTDLKLAFRYLIPSYIIACFFIFLLGSYILRGIKKPGTAAATAAVLFAAIFLSCIIKNYYENDRSNNFIAYNYPHDLLSYLPQKSYVFTSGDNQIYTMAYDKFVEGRYSDIVIEDQADTIFKDIDGLAQESRSYMIPINMGIAFKRRMSPIFTTIELNSQQTSQSMYGFMVRATDSKPEKDVLSPWRLYPLKGILNGPNISYTYEEREVVGFYLLKMAEFYKKLGKKDLYYYLYEQAAEKGYDSVAVLGNLAIRYSADNSGLPDGPERSEILYNKALALDPDNENILFNAGSFYARMGIWQKAGQFFSKTVELNPSNIMARIYLSKVQKQLDSQAGAQKLLKEQSAHFDAGTEFLKKKQYDQALVEFSRDIEINPEYDRSYFHMGLIYSIQGKFDKAIPLYEKAIECNTKETAAMNNLGIIYYKMGKREKAKFLFEQSLSLRPNQPRIQRMLDDVK
jgi:tetratricopeptide (TPR) repeat protein